MMLKCHSDCGAKRGQLIRTERVIRISAQITMHRGLAQKDEHPVTEQATISERGRFSKCQSTDPG